MYVVWCTCAYYANITFCALSIYVYILRVCSVEGRAFEMTERRLFSKSIPLELNFTAKEEKLPPFSHTQDKRQTFKLNEHITERSTCEQSVREFPLSPGLAPSKHHFTQAMSLRLAQSTKQLPPMQPSHVPVSMPTQ